MDEGVREGANMTHSEDILQAVTCPMLSCKRPLYSVMVGIGVYTGSLPVCMSTKIVGIIPVSFPPVNPNPYNLPQLVKG